MLFIHVWFVIFCCWNLRNSQYVELYENGIFQGNFSTLEDPLINLSSHWEKMLFISNESPLKSFDIFNEIIISEKTTIYGKDDFLDTITFHNILIIENYLNLTNIVISAQLKFPKLFQIRQNAVFYCSNCILTKIEGEEDYQFIFSFQHTKTDTYLKSGRE